MSADDYLDDDNVADLAFGVERKARKNYTCDCCGESINAGEQYDHFKWLFDERWSSCRTCQRCVDFCRELNEAKVLTKQWRGEGLLEAIRWLVEYEGLDFYTDDQQEGMKRILGDSYVEQSS